MLTNEQIDNKLEHIAGLVSRLSYEASEIYDNFCADNGLSELDYKVINSVGTKLICVLEKEILKLERQSDKLNKVYFKRPEIQ